MSQLITIKLSKSPGQPWGFRLQGGKDFAQPLCIQKVNPGSVAAAAGVAAGDAIVTIGGRDALALRHKEAQDAIVSAGDCFDMLVQRGSMTWKPKVTPLEQPKATPEGPVATKTSLAAAGKQPTKAPKGFNAAPQGFGQVNGTPLTTPQYNSPINLYNEEAIAEALSSQAEVLGNTGKGCLGINFRKFDREVKLRTDSPTYMLLHGEEPAAAPKPRKQLPPPAEAPGQDKPVFPAAQPGQQPGYYNVNDKMYCDIHAKQAAKHNPPAPNMVPVTVKPGAAPPHGAMSAPDHPAPHPQESEPLPQAPPALPREEPSEEPQQVSATVPEPETELPEPVPAPQLEPASPKPEESSDLVQEPEEQSKTDIPNGTISDSIQPIVEPVNVPETESHSQVQSPTGQMNGIEQQPSAEVLETVTSVKETSQTIVEQTVRSEDVVLESLKPAEDIASTVAEPEASAQVAPTEVEAAPPTAEVIAKPVEESLPTAFVPVPEQAPASVTPVPAPVKAPAPAPAPAKAPAFPPSMANSANPHAFGAPAGDVDVRAHIPKKVNRFQWPPAPPAPEDSLQAPSWAPAGEVLKVPAPQRPSGPLPNTIPLLPTPPPPKNYESKLLSTMSAEEIAAMREEQKTFVQKTTTVQESQSFHRTQTLETQTIQKQSFSSSSQQQQQQQTNVVSNSTFSSQSEHGVSNSDNSVAFTATQEVMGTKTGNISPIKTVPVTQPMPSVDFGPQIPMPESAPITVTPQIDLPSKPTSSVVDVPGVVKVKAPVGSTNKLTPREAPAPIDPSSLPFAVAPLPFDDTLSKAPAPLSNKVVEPPKTKPAPSSLPRKQPDPVKPAPAPAPVQKTFAPAPVSAPKPAPAPTPAPVSAPKPAPAPVASPFIEPPSAGAPPSMLGGMPKPAPPPAMGGMGGMPKPPGVGAAPTKGVPGERTAPKRGRGVMNQAVASRIPVCAGCQNQIRGPFVTALGKNWCPNCFHCATASCCKPLIDIGFVEEQGQLYCEDCYERFLAPTCAKCGQRIKGDCLNAVGKQFHPECFSCAYCGKVFGSGAFYLEDGLPYCEADWNDLFTTKCVGCGFPIEAGDRWVEALNNNYHSQCFKCSKCHKNLEGQSFFAKGGKPFCKAHAQRGF